MNPKHYSNEEESIKVLNEIIIPYIIKERKSLALSENHPALLLMDVFKGQMTEKVLKVLSENNIVLQTVLANLTYHFQPLDVQGGPNGFVKRLMKTKFTNWYAEQVTKALDEGQELGSVDVPLKLTIMKPLHAKWLMEIYNEMTSSVGREVCVKGWKVAGIKDAVSLGLTNLPAPDPFHDIDRMLDGNFALQSVDLRNISEASKYVSEFRSESDSDEEEWANPNDPDDEANYNRNIFESFDDEGDI